MEEIKVNVTASGNEVIVREGEAAPIYNYQGFSHAAYSTQSFIDLVKSKANQPAAVIAYNEKQVQAILDDTVKDRRQDKVYYDFKRSQQFDEWAGILGRGVVFEQKEIIDFVRRREEGEIPDAEELLATLRNFRFAVTTTGDCLYEDNSNYTFAIKVGEQEGAVSIPKAIYPNIEIYNESGLIQSIEIEIEVTKPRSQDEKLKFSLTCPKFKRYEKEALDSEIKKVKDGLEGFLIVAGDIFR